MSQHYVSSWRSADIYVNISRSHIFLSFIDETVRNQMSCPNNACCQKIKIKTEKQKGCCSLNRAEVCECLDRNLWAGTVLCLHGDESLTSSTLKQKAEDCHLV